MKIPFFLIVLIFITTMVVFNNPNSSIAWWTKSVMVRIGSYLWGFNEITSVYEAPMMVHLEHFLTQIGDWFDSPICCELRHQLQNIGTQLHQTINVDAGWNFCHTGKVELNVDGFSFKSNQTV